MGIKGARARDLELCLTLIDNSRHLAEVSHEAVFTILSLCGISPPTRSDFMRILKRR